MVATFEKQEQNVKAKNLKISFEFSLHAFVSFVGASGMCGPGPLLSSRVAWGPTSGLQVWHQVPLITV